MNVKLVIVFYIFFVNLCRWVFVLHGWLGY